MTLVITCYYCFVIDANFSCCDDVFANITPMFATQFVAIRFVISYSIPG